MKLISLNDFGVQNWIVILFLKKLPIIIAISVSASVSADMKIFISAFYRYRPIRKRELSALYRYRPIWKKAYRSTAAIIHAWPSTPYYFSSLPEVLDWQNITLEVLLTNERGFGGPRANYNGGSPRIYT